ncbi:hypothetical protein K435DRAFT_719053 [Dendrothele bispora CBS 962.96]|uniref:Phytanoyl-CoA dioxygenase n=1 Tax=Dendrothele bispora (strain CBS 962.96) TaxID=1314807 RepID=A0A4S8MCV3_DENBC|nr:hypothetical protein K435DRAFT_719053 [Dendrothele bispora CBS 962.96]
MSAGLAPIADPSYYTVSDAKFEDFRRIVEQKTLHEDYPLASSIAKDLIPIYDCPALRAAGKLTPVWSDPANLPLREEFIRALKRGPGVVVFRGAFTNMEEFDAGTKVLEELIQGQRKVDKLVRDENYIVPNTNEHWAKRDPGSYSDYFKNDVIALASGAWLGPWYQMTSQISQCVPGNKAQRMHRDYHLGVGDRFPYKRGDDVISPIAAAVFPAHMHVSSHYMTLQGAIAHVDMPLESGPTMFLPYSQLYEHGYLTSGVPEFYEYFAANHVQTPLQKGDAVFFSPGIYHGAGQNNSGPKTNTPPVDRIANLLQISSAFGRPSDNADRRATTNYVYPHLLEQRKKFQESGGKAGYSDNELWNIISSTAEGYLFPTNLRFVNGIFQAPQNEVVWKALMNGTPPEELAKVLEEEEKLNKNGIPPI